MALEVKPFDVVDYLTSNEDLTAYLNEALEGNDPRDIAHTLSDVARARGGLELLAEKTGISYEKLQNALSHGAVMDFTTLLKITEALGVKFSATIAA